MIKLNEEQKLTSKNILFDCPVCKCKLQLRNEIAINPKLTKTDKTMSVNKDDEGGLHWIVKTTALVSVGIELELLQPMMKRINMT